MRDGWSNAWLIVALLCGVVIVLCVGVIIKSLSLNDHVTTSPAVTVTCPKCEALTELLAEQRASYNVERETLRAQIVGMVNQHTAQLKKIEDLLFKEATNGDQKRATGTQAARQGN